MNGNISHSKRATIFIFFEIFFSSSRLSLVTFVMSSRNPSLSTLRHKAVDRNDRQYLQMSYIMQLPRFSRDSWHRVYLIHFNNSSAYDQPKRGLMAQGLARRADDRKIPDSSPTQD